MDNRSTTNQGAPAGNDQSTQTAGQYGPTLLERDRLLEKIARFDQEQDRDRKIVPERAVHARGAGAHGVFRAENGMSEYTKARFLSETGLETPVFVRFSTVIHGTDSPEAAREPRGFAVKFYTKEGNYDLVGSHLPVFFIRDAEKLPEMAQSLKPDPAANFRDPARYWDFMTLAPESTHMLTWVFSDDGTPASYREMDGFSVHAFKWVNDAGKVTYVKYTWKSQQGVRCLTAKEASDMLAKDINHATRDLYASIELGNYPKWDLYVQLMPPEHMDRYPFDPLDPTKVWPENLYPLQKVGTMTLNCNPINYFSDVEQSAFSPSAVVPGIELSEDQPLQGRLLSSPDTERYRLDVDYLNIPVNKPLRSRQSDGAMTGNATPPSANNEPNRDSGSLKEDSSSEDKFAPLHGSAGRQRIEKTDDFTQAGERYRSLTELQQANLISNLADDLKQTNDDIRLRAICNFFRADRTLGFRLAEGLGVDIRQFVPQR
ncbi:catalase [Paenibacillus nanensis]|uniref:catalase n=1 Tax=Paenibacillus nanensis TaxID=393251 RepID=A0A3A1UY53_9BACL|nr:catalase [Paenibacillus nanensis]RIX51243.1 catalase [Paenibacillus nanensis]